MKVALPCEVFTLDNGLRLIVHEEHSTPLAAVNVWYHVGSRDEQPGRTGFAHLFEHLMFEGSANVPPGEFDRALEAVGGSNNGSTCADRTNYWETVPATALELALFLEADRMGSLLDVLNEERFEAQRDVVINERRESYENRPYGLAHETLLGALYPPDHPYHWPVIGFMRDIEAATLADAEDFCRTWYTPDNASLAVAGDVKTDAVHAMVRRLFNEIPRGGERRRTTPPPVRLETEPRLVLEDAVQLPRLYMAWHSPPTFAPGDAELDAVAHVLAAGKASRLYRALIAESELAVDVTAEQQSGQYGSTFVTTATARPGQALGPIEERVRAEIARLVTGDLQDIDVERARNSLVNGTLDELQTVGGFGGRADRLNLYEHHVGTPDYIQQDLDRYLRLDAATTAATADAVLHHALPAVLAIVPRGQTALAPPAERPG